MGRWQPILGTVIVGCSFVASCRTKVRTEVRAIRPCRDQLFPAVAQVDNV